MSTPHTPAPRVAPASRASQRPAGDLLRRPGVFIPAVAGTEARAILPWPVRDLGDLRAALVAWRVPARDVAVQEAQIAEDEAVAREVESV